MNSSGGKTGLVPVLTWTVLCLLFYHRYFSLPLYYHRHIAIHKVQDSQSLVKGIV